MKKAPALLLLLLVTAAAGFWMLRAGPTQEIAREILSSEDCESGDSCSAGIARAPDENDASVSTDSKVAAGPDGATAASVPPEERASRRPAEPPVDAAKLREEADRLIAARDFPRGIELLRKATYADPSARNHGDLGALLAKATAFHEALIHLRAAAELDPHNADRWIALANGYYRSTDLGEAWKAEKRALEAEPGLELGRDAHGMRVRKGDSAAGTP